MFNIFSKALLALALGCVTFVSGAYGQSEEIVVTGSRIAQNEPQFIPVAHIVQKADFLILTTYVESDSRDYGLRKKEVTETLKAMEKKAARNKNIELGFIHTFETEDDEFSYVVPFSTESLSQDIFGTGYRADTTRANIIAKHLLAKMIPHMSLS